MAFFNHVIEADISAHTYPEPILVKQGDSGRAIIIYPTSGGEPWQIPDGATAVVHILNPMHQSATYEAEITENEGRQCILFRISAEALLEAGRASMDATVTVNGVTVSTLNFMLDIEPAPASDFPIPTPGGGVTREELDVALRQNSAVDQAFASAAAQTVADNTEEQLAEIREQTGIEIRPRISFVDDDGGAEIFSTLYPWMQQHQVPYTFAISVGDVGSSSKFATWDQLQQMAQSSLVDFSCHAVGDDVMSDYTADEMAAKYERWRSDMAAHGLRPDASAVMYNHGTYVQSTIDAVVSKYFRFGFTVTKGINAAPFDSYHMKRVGLFPTDGSFTIAQAKAYVDQLAESGDGWLVFFTHCYYPTFDLDGLTELVEYIRSKGIMIDGAETVSALYAKSEPGEPGEWKELEAAETAYNAVIGKASGTSPGLKTSSSSAANCVSSYAVAPGSKLQISGTAYSQESGSYGKYSFLRADGSLISCDWWAEPKSGANARFNVEDTVPAGVSTLLVSGNSGQLLPSAKAWSSGTVTAEEARAIADEQIAANVPEWAREETKPTYTASDVGAIPATDYAAYADTKAGTAKKALPASLQHTAVLFGLSKAAGVDLAGRTDVGLGNYPADAKEAIARMLGVPTESQFFESIAEISESIAEIADVVTEYSESEGEKIIDVPVTKQYGYINTNSGRVVVTSDATRFVLSCDVSSGEQYRVKCNYLKNKYAVGYAITDVNNVVIVEYYDPSATAWQFQQIFDVTIPEGGVKLYAHAFSETNDAYIKKLELAKKYRARAYDKTEVYTKAETDALVVEKIENSKKPLPCILVNFDAPTPCFSDGRHELCMKYGIPYTVNVTIEADGSVGYPDVQYGQNHISEMLADGVDFAVYSKQLPQNYADKIEDMSYLSEFETYVKNAREYAETKGIFNPTAWFCRYMDTGTVLNQALINNGFKICRGNKTHITQSESTRKMWDKSEFNRFDASKFNVPSIGCNVTSYGIRLIDYIDQAVENGMDIAPFAHGVYDTEEEARPSNGTTREILDAVLSHIHDLVVQGKAEAVTFREYYEKLYPSDARLNDISRERKYSDWKYGQNS